MGIRRMSINVNFIRCKNKLYSEICTKTERLILSPAFSGIYYSGPSCECLISTGTKLPMQVSMK